MGDAVSFTIDWSRREVVAVSRDPTNALRIVAMWILIMKTMMIMTTMVIIVTTMMMMMKETFPAWAST